jgi:hypothetical protein
VRGALRDGTPLNRSEHRLPTAFLDGCVYLWRKASEAVATGRYW